MAKEVAPKKSEVMKVAKENKIPKGFIEAKEGKYRCKKKCYFGIRLYAEGAIYEATKGELIPYHFEKVKKYVEVDD